MNNISFSQIIKEELCLLELTKNEEVILLSAFFKVNGTLVFSKNEEKIVLCTENAKIAKYIYSLIKKHFENINISFGFRKSMKFNKNTQYLININEDTKKIITYLNINFLDSKIPYNFTDKDNKISAYLKGLFLASGMCNNPNSSNYHLEMTTKNENYANSIVKMILKIKAASFNFRIIKRRKNYVIYLKRSDQISSFLAFIDATNSCLEFENVRLDRDFTNVNNRIMICDSYNYKKSLNKSNELIASIKTIEDTIGLSRLNNEKLIYLCILRKENPELSYNELAELLSKKLGYKVSKSNIQHMFLKINNIAKDLKNGNE